MTKSAAQIIDVTVGEKTYCFEVTRESYNKYVNSLLPNSKVAPSHNFLVGTVQKDDEKALLELIKSAPGIEMDLVGAVLQEYTPDLAITAKKRSA